MSLLGLNLTFVPKGKYKSHVVIIPAAKRSFMIDKIPYFFRQDTDFRYLTGCMEQDCVLVMEVTKDAEKSTLLVRDPNAREEKWEGPRTRPGLESGDFFGVDRVLPFTHFGELLRQFKDRNGGEFMLWYDQNQPRSAEVHFATMDFVRNCKTGQVPESPRPLVHQLRVLKTPAEIALMRRSCSIAAESISETMRLSLHLKTEAQVLATVDYQCRMKGAEFLAYPPVVAAGNNANVIHYTQCNQELQKDQLILMDAGCELHGYTSDITRTWPAGGKFSPAQKIIYEIVLDVQTELLGEIHNGGGAGGGGGGEGGVAAAAAADKRPTIDDLYHSMQRRLAKHLRNENLVRKNLTEAELIGRTAEFCPHHVSHYLGMDVHDTALISRAVPLQKGMVVTVEPGVYIPADCAEVPIEFRGIGVRIEDDVLVTEGGCEVMSGSCPTSVEKVEGLLRR